MLLGAVATEPVIDVLLAAALTWAAHSSVAVVLLVMSLAAKGVVPPDAAFALVLGANLGTAINPLLEGGGERRPGRQAAAARQPDQPRRRLRARPGRCSTWIGPLLVTIEPDPARAVADFHTVFNLVLALLFFPLLRPVRAAAAPARCRRASTRPTRRRPLYLDDGRARDAGDRARRRRARGAAHGRRAGGDAARRARRARPRRPQAVARDQAARRRARPAERRHQGLPDRARPRRRSTDADHRRLSARSSPSRPISSMPATSSTASVMVARRQAAEARGRLLGRGRGRDPRAALERLSRQPARRRGRVHDRGRRAARGLVGREGSLPRSGGATRPRPISRACASGRAGASRRAALHLDLLRDLKRVNAHLVAAAAYPVLEAEGELLPSRLREFTELP